MAKKYISNKDETPRLFENVLMEKLSRVHPSVPLIIYVPVIALFVYRGAVSEALSAVNLTGLFLLGTLFWTFMEYVIHRFAFHYMPKSELGKRFHFLIHGIHHDYPKDSKRLVMPPSVSVPLAVVFYLLYMAIMGQTYGELFFAGFVFGYLCYDMIHYMLHHFSMRDNRLGLWLQQHHNLHHYSNDDKGFGVSSPLWDLVFKTMDPKMQEKKRQPVQSD